MLLTSYEIVLRDTRLFKSIAFETVVIDEAHRMKTVTAQTRQVIDGLSMKWLLLLTGSPSRLNQVRMHSG